MEHGRNILSSFDWTDVLKVEDLLLQEKQTDLVSSDIVKKESETELEGKPVILLVEDSEEVMELLVSIFSSVYIVYKADNGQAGYEQALKTILFLSELPYPIKCAYFLIDCYNKPIIV